MKKGKKHNNTVKNNKKNKKGLLFHLKVIFLASFVCILAFGLSYKIFSPHLASPNCANSKTCNLPLTLSVMNNSVGFFEGKKVYPPQIDLNSMAYTPVLGASTGLKHIYVDLLSQTLYAYQGNTLFLKARTSTGRWAPTPTGNFHIRQKLLSTLMAGGEGADAYYLPNIRYTQYFFRDYALHEAYWHDNFGTTMSHGCVNLRYVDARTLYNWTDGPSNGNLGTEVSVCDYITNDRQCIQNNPVM